MKYINWNKHKNEILKKTRGISFEEVVLLIESNNILQVEKNPSRNQQYIFILEINNYAVVVPYVETETEIFLKTIFQSRKYTKKFKLGGDL